ncbi:F0F1 ATP synthase subunit gamma [Desulfovermiculus halophilus]|jgi:F-type H+-transporting ATPase subunit gamma|uniref:F0F1 ATP synthase subunit gamma n=1 Tax=Desulfovermiculus halophilus TaxID=339722 RepID=UPI0004844C6B|nr:F0F1 ATP synthase subunit gamma [Desulfovermiculus halophilus]
MPSLKEVQNKIASVKKTKQITRAMNMVASAKLRKAQDRIERFRPYAEKFYEMLGEMSGGVEASAHPLLEHRDTVNTVGILLMTSDRGLCGGFNTNLIQKSLRIAREKAAEGKTVVFYCVGKKARNQIRKREFDVVMSRTDCMDGFDFSLANDLGTELISSYVNQDVDEVHLVYGEFLSVAKQEPKALQLLPVVQSEVQEETEESGATAQYMYEPSVDGILAELLPRFIKVQVYRGLLETSASEHAARMTAMDNASSNCDDMISNLTLAYNKARQAAITAELLDIVGGAEALK